jgi:Fe-S cluster assembly protein SufD
MNSAALKTRYSGDFAKSLETVAQPEWLKELRTRAFSYFEGNGFPTPENEEWKYTNVSSFAGDEWSLAADSKQEFSAFIHEESKDNVLVFLNGKFSQALSRCEGFGEAVVLGFSDALADEKYSDILRTKLGTLIGTETNGFTALNTAFIEDGAFIFLPKNTKIDSPVQLLFMTDEGRVAFPRILIVAEAFSEATFIESYSRASESRYLTNAVIEVSLADEAKIKHFRVQRESHNAFHIGASGAEVERGSVYDSTNINLGAKLSRHEIAVRFNSEGGEVFVDGLYMLGEDQHHDTHSLIDHRVPNCVSHQSYKGIVDGKAHAVFNGKIFVRENASGTDGYQSNKNLLLSNDARVDGATVGQLEDEELFYLLSRGIRESLARNLLTYGFAEEVINKIDVESVKAKLDEAVLNRLNAQFLSK